MDIEGIFYYEVRIENEIINASEVSQETYGPLVQQ